MDFIIKGATLFDGSGQSRRENCDLAVRAGRIDAVGPDLAVPKGAEVIDADGLALMPGIIDTHTHYDAQATWDPGLSPSPAHGVTSVVIGNCGFTIAPCREEDRELVMRNLTQVEGMSLDVLRQGIVWDFETFPEYLASLERRGTQANVAAFLGHSALRSYVMGDAAVERAATDEEVAEMRRHVGAAMAAGAIGFATSTAPQHNGWGGVPMPSRLADDREHYALVREMAGSGRGLFMLTKGNHTDVPWLEALAGAAHCPVMIAALLHNPTNPQGTFKELAQISEARSRGRELWGQVSCCPLTMDFSLASAYPLESLTAWQPAMAATGEELHRLLADAAFRQSVKEELEQPAGVRLFNGEWDKLALTEAAREENRHLEHRSIAELAAEADQHPLDWLLDFGLSENLESLFTAILLNADEEAVGRMIRHPDASVALSDAGAHLTFFCDAGFGLHLMGHWARRRGVLSLEEAVRELTAKPAEIFRLPNRGRLAPGYAADLLLFDPETVDRGPNRRVHDLPGGGARLTTDAIGLQGVWVNGVRIVDGQGRLSSDRAPGQLMRPRTATAP
ncbi:N-acyl-D-amino-acid deacylase family protein [Aquibaculum sediminis]|uniref:N-acyl-D-amino-acid deacylase family protein n=1 Tax=Aquibaculum sediminis TaxID=3231907 RepID=UPI0034515BF9